MSDFKPDQAVPRPVARNTDRKTEGQAPIDAVARAIGEMRYGTIQLTVHDGRVVQLDVTERQRFS
jgi:hypothetical protein